MKSESINELAAALVKAQAEFGAVPKGSVNPFFKSKYAALPDVVAHATPILTKHGLAVSQFIEGEYLGVDALTTYLIHESGQFIAHTMKLHLVKDDPQAQGSAVTYARRYAYMSALGLVADEDDDGNKATQAKSGAVYEQSKPTYAKPAVQAKPLNAPGDAPQDIKDIIKAAELAPTDEFLNSLAQQFLTKGNLSEKQVMAGKKKAYAVLKNQGTVQNLTEAFGAIETEEEPF